MLRYSSDWYTQKEIIVFIIFLLKCFIVIAQKHIKENDGGI